MNPAAHAEFEPGDWSPSAAARQRLDLAPSHANPLRSACQSGHIPGRGRSIRAALELGVTAHPDTVATSWSTHAPTRNVPPVGRSRFEGRSQPPSSSAVASPTAQAAANVCGSKPARAAATSCVYQAARAADRKGGDIDSTEALPRIAASAPKQYRAGSPPTSAGRRRYQGGHANVAHSGPARHRDA
jgi:hypothetical protein